MRFGDIKNEGKFRMGKDFQIANFGNKTTVPTLPMWYPLRRQRFVSGSPKDSAEYYFVANNTPPSPPPEDYRPFS